MFHRGTSGVMNHNKGRRLAVLRYWKCEIICIQFCAWLPNYMNCLFHVNSARVIIEQQREGVVTFHEV